MSEKDIYDFNFEELVKELASLSSSLIKKEESITPSKKPQGVSKPNEEKLEKPISYGRLKQEYPNIENDIPFHRPVEVVFANVKEDIAGFKNLIDKYIEFITTFVYSGCSYEFVKKDAINIEYYNSLINGKASNDIVGVTLKPSKLFKDKYIMAYFVGSYLKRHSKKYYMSMDFQNATPSYTIRVRLSETQGVRIYESPFLDSKQFFEGKSRNINLAGFGLIAKNKEEITYLYDSIKRIFEPYKDYIKVGLYTEGTKYVDSKRVQDDCVLIALKRPFDIFKEINEPWVKAYISMQDELALKHEVSKFLSGGYPCYEI